MTFSKEILNFLVCDLALLDADTTVDVFSVKSVFFIATLKGHLSMKERKLGPVWKIFMSVCLNIHQYFNAFINLTSGM